MGKVRTCKFTFALWERGCTVKLQVWSRMEHWMFVRGLGRYWVSHGVTSRRLWPEGGHGAQRAGAGRAAPQLQPQSLPPLRAHSRALRHTVRASPLQLRGLKQEHGIGKTLKVLYAHITSWSVKLLIQQHERGIWGISWLRDKICILCAGPWGSFSPVCFPYVLQACSGIDFKTFSNFRLRLFKCSTTCTWLFIDRSEDSIFKERFLRFETQSCKRSWHTQAYARWGTKRCELYYLLYLWEDSRSHEQFN